MPRVCPVQPSSPLFPEPHLPKLPTPVLSLPGHQVTRHVCFPITEYQAPSLGGKPRQVDTSGVTAVTEPRVDVLFPPAQPGRAGWGCPTASQERGREKPPGPAKQTETGQRPGPSAALDGSVLCCGYQSAHLHAITWPTKPASAGTRPG